MTSDNPVDLVEVVAKIHSEVRRPDGYDCWNGVETLRADRAASEARGYARAVEDAARWLDSFGGRAYYESDWTLGKVLRSKLRTGGKTND